VPGGLGWCDMLLCRNSEICGPGIEYSRRFTHNNPQTPQTPAGSYGWRVEFDRVWGVECGVDGIGNSIRFSYINGPTGRRHY
jgi:hypothetical protein